MGSLNLKLNKIEARKTQKNRNQKYNIMLFDSYQFYNLSVLKKPFDKRKYKLFVIWFNQFGNLPIRQCNLNLEKKNNPS